MMLFNSMAPRMKKATVMVESPILFAIVAAIASFGTFPQAAAMPLASYAWPTPPKVLLAHFDTARKWPLAHPRECASRTRSLDKGSLVGLWFGAAAALQRSETVRGAALRPPGALFRKRSASADAPDNPNHSPTTSSSSAPKPKRGESSADTTPATPTSARDAERRHAWDKRMRRVRDGTATQRDIDTCLAWRGRQGAVLVVQSISGGSAVSLVCSGLVLNLRCVGRSPCRSSI
jgi:hypothetical protein